MTGTDWKLKLSLVEGCRRPHRRQNLQPKPSRASLKPDESLDSFKDDPLIQEALEIFKGEIKSVTT